MEPTPSTVGTVTTAWNGIAYCIMPIPRYDLGIIDKVRHVLDVILRMSQLSRRCLERSCAASQLPRSLDAQRTISCSIVARPCRKILANTQIRVAATHGTVEYNFLWVTF
jgi:hypothetical protein